MGIDKTIKMAYAYANSIEHKLLTFAILHLSDNKNINFHFLEGKNISSLHTSGSQPSS